MNLLESQFTQGINGKISSNQKLFHYLQHVCPLHIGLSRAKRLTPKRISQGVRKLDRPKRMGFLDGENM